jgi:hypothetical protein
MRPRIPALPIRPLHLIALGLACPVLPLFAAQAAQAPGGGADSGSEAEPDEPIEEITISAPAVDPLSAERNATGIHLDGDLLKDLPVKMEDPLAVASLFVDPAANDAEGTKIVVDGVEGDTLDVPSASIKTIAVNSNPYSAEFGRPGTGRIEVTTRGGSRHRFHRRLELAYRDNNLDAHNPFDTVRPARRRDWAQGELDGPLVGDKATFFLSGDYLRDDNNSFVTAVTPSGPVSETLPLPRRTAHLLGRSDVRLTPQQLLTLRYNWSDDRQSNQGVGAFDLPERAWSSHSRTQELRIAEIATPGEALQNELRLDLKSRSKLASSASDAPALLINGSFNSGGAQIARSSRERDLELQDLASYGFGRHSLRFGAFAKSRLIDYTDASNFGGTYTFSDLASFVNRQPLQFTLHFGNARASFTQNEFAYFLQDQVRLGPRVELMAGLRHEFQSNLEERANLAPRLALSAATEDGRTVLRAGSGIFYQRQPPGLEEQYLLLNGSHLQQVTLSNPGFPVTANPLSTSAPPSVLRVDPHIRAPYLTQASLGVEHKLAAATTLTAEYTLMRGERLYRLRDINAPLPVSGLRPNPAFLNVDQFETTGSSRMDSLSLGLNTRIADRLQVVLRYTLSHSIDDTSCTLAQPGLCTPPADSYDPSAERGPSGFDQRHRFNLAGILSMPGSVTLGCLVSLASAIPYNITTGFDDNHDTVVNDRPTLANPGAPYQSFGIDGSFVGGTPGVLYDGAQALFGGRLVPTTVNSVHWLVLPGPGTVGRNTGRGPSFAEVDLRLAKRFMLREGSKSKSAEYMDVRLDAFNLLNHINLANYVGTLSSPYFGRANDAHVPREIQLSVRVHF